MSEEIKREVVEPGKFVAYSYKLYNDADNSLLFETPKNAPDVMVYGVSHEIVPGLAAAMKGLAKGDKFGITLPPEAAFGNRSDEFLIELDKEIFMRDGELAEEVKVGAKLPMMTAEGYRVEGEVVEIGDKIKMDFNHPFAGLTVRYEGEIDEVRDATPEELHPQGGCCGGCGGGCGSDGDCSDGCGSGSCGCN
ncbi:MAG: FKBP-type peptidyl-prolyl cis-trans isomerase [Muribaculaceae bacterium]|nr:FKBP-type peptidyl-prolyl cis-trans isomerase [Muribaculaceae bacterium]MDE6755321.1 FKBP-type peptidyl-prolyl cis-trans isomerase [Muribaculaceae bacterium]